MVLILKFLNKLKDFLDSFELKKFAMSLNQIGYEIKRKENYFLIEINFFNTDIKGSLTKELQKNFPQEKFLIQMQAPAQNQDQKLKTVKSIIAVASGKGGVGKSSTSVNLAFALKSQGAKVGILDADIYGPSIPKMLGVADYDINTQDGKIMEPIFANGIVCNSLGFLIKENNAAMWRGPMAAKALEQLLFDTNWPEIDYLIIDMPPGTGDIQMSLSGLNLINETLIVTTAEDVATLDAKRAICMFEKLGTKISAVVENMSHFICTKCSEKHEFFGIGGAKNMANEKSLPLLASIPFSPVILSANQNGLDIFDEETTVNYLDPYIEFAKNFSILIAKSHKKQQQEDTNFVSIS